MARKPDGGLRAMFRRNMKQIHWTTIESILTEGGIPDLNGCVDGVEFWIECKVARGWKVAVRPAQISWIRRRVKVGGHVYIAVKRRKELWLIAGAAVNALARGGLRAVPRAAVRLLLPQPWPWAAVAATLGGATGRLYAVPRRKAA
jgi:hypothetical protein